LDIRTVRRLPKLWLISRLAIGYFVGWLSYVKPLADQRKKLARNPEGTAPELRLWWLLYSESFLLTRRY
jgi:hypothetical protein